MNKKNAARRAVGPLALLLVLSNAAVRVVPADEPPPKVIDSQTIVRSLTPETSMTRGFVVAGYDATPT